MFYTLLNIFSFTFYSIYVFIIFVVFKYSFRFVVLPIVISTLISYNSNTKTKPDIKQYTKTGSSILTIPSSLTVKETNLHFCCSFQVILGTTLSQTKLRTVVHQHSNQKGTALQSIRRPRPVYFQSKGLISRLVLTRAFYISGFYQSLYLNCKCMCVL